MLRATRLPWTNSIRPWACAGLLLVYLAPLYGCAIDRTGAVWARVVPADGAWVLQVHAPGAYLQTEGPGDAALTVGYSRREYVFSGDDVSMPKEGWHLF